MVERVKPTLAEALGGFFSIRSRTERAKHFKTDNFFYDYKYHSKHL